MKYLFATAQPSSSWRCWHSSSTLLHPTSMPGMPSTLRFWLCGKQDRWRDRRQNAGLRFHSGWKSATVVGLAAFTVAGAWIWYNTAVLNRLVGPQELLRRQAEYEKTYKQFDKQLQPRVKS